jgi:hypothetical protein
MISKLLIIAMANSHETTSFKKNIQYMFFLMAVGNETANFPEMSFKEMLKFLKKKIKDCMHRLFLFL